VKPLLPLHLDQRVFGLDLLRAIAIVNVVHLHGYAFVERQVPHALYALPVLADGVALFFVLSGFLIGGIVLKLFDRPRFNASTVLQFWRRRWFRTLPNYFLALIAVAAVSGLSMDALAPLLLRCGFFVQNFAWPHPNFFNEAWSLAVEEWFYLILPLAAVACHSFAARRRAFLVMVIAVLVLVPVFRAWRWSLHGPVSAGEWDLLFRRQVVTQFDSLMFGVLAAWWRHYHLPSWNAIARAALAFALTGFVTLRLVLHAAGDAPAGFYKQVLYFPTISGLKFLTLPFLSSFQARPGWIVRIVTTVSILSYAMYLVNFSLIRNWLLPNLGERWPVLNTGLPGLAFFWTLTLLLSWAVYRSYEAPLTRLRERFELAAPAND